MFHTFSCYFYNNFNLNRAIVDHCIFIALQNSVDFSLIIHYPTENEPANSIFHTFLRNFCNNFNLNIAIVDQCIFKTFTISVDFSQNQS